MKARRAIEHIFLHKLYTGKIVKNRDKSGVFKEKPAYFSAKKRQIEKILSRKSLSSKELAIDVICNVFARPVLV
jgi:hypothetical protein